jgi:hypothetical protein
MPGGMSNWIGLAALIVLLAIVIVRMARSRK